MTTSSAEHPATENIDNRQIVLFSDHLQREVPITIIRPKADGPYPLVLFQDGQDFPALRMTRTVSGLLEAGEICPTLFVGIHANENRIQEYGVAAEADYKGRGSLAGAYSRFVVSELLPFLEEHFPIRAGRHVIAGFSLGGLMALDLAWNHPELFSHAGVFSGSLWWRRKAFDENYEDKDRIMHQQIALCPHQPDLKFWFQTGSADETSDRDRDGVIDSIGDTLDCIAELERKGYRWGSDVRYLEIAGGRHHPDTWAEAMPAFLRWAIGQS